MSVRRWLVTILCIDLALWFGAAVYFSLFAAIELSQSLSVDDFGKTIGILFPTYFTLMAVTAVIGWFLAMMFMRGSAARGSAITCQVFATIGAIIALVNRFYFLPVIQEIEAKMGPYSQASANMQRQFGMNHGISMLLDFIMLVCVLLMWIALSIHLTHQSGGRRP